MAETQGPAHEDDGSTVRPMAGPVQQLMDFANKSGDEVKGRVQLGLKETTSLSQAIRIAVGAASMCWDHVERAGTYDPEMALDIATQLEHEIQKFTDYDVNPQV